jgi:hypothetical protein
MCFVFISLVKAVYFFSPLPLSKSRLAVTLHAGDVRLFGKTHLIMGKDVIAASGAATKCAVAITKAPSSFQAH